MAQDAVLAVAHRRPGLDLMIGERSAEASQGARYRLRWSLPLGWDRLPGQTLECFSGHAWEVVHPGPDGSPGHVIKGDVWESQIQSSAGSRGHSGGGRILWELRWAQPPMGAGSVSIAPLGLSLVHTLILLGVRLAPSLDLIPAVQRSGLRIGSP